MIIPYVYAICAFVTAYFQKRSNSSIFSLQKPDRVILVIRGNIGQHALDNKTRN